MQYQPIFVVLSYLLYSVIIFKMGAVQSEESTAFLPDNYEILRVQKDLKILLQRKSGSQFALLQQSFVNKHAYDSHFKRTREKENSMRQSENILKMVKLWSKEHNGVCSNLFKIYTVYEYPKVRLIDEIEARKTEEKHFEETEILSILQSCLNAFMAEPSYSNISPHLIFIFPEGILKVINIELTDPHYQCIFNSQYYYSPEKMKNFQSILLSKEENQKESVFSMGMTLLHAALLDDVSTCYEISMKRFNKKKLEHLKQRLGKKYSEDLCNLIGSMLVSDHQTRIGMHQLQRVVDQLSSQPLTINSFVENDQLSSDQHLQPISELFINTNEKQRKEQGEGSHNNFNTSSLTMSNFVNPIRKSEFQIIVDPHIGNSASKRFSQPKQGSQDKQNIFTDGRIMTMIKQGLQKIDKASKQRSVMKQIKNSENKSRNAITSSKDLLSQYELNTNSKPLQSEFAVQQYQDQSRYEGRIERGMKNGFGKLIYPDGVFYQGSFKDDTLCGRGALYYGPNRPAYIGDWQDNKFNGQGTLYNEYSTLIETPFDYSDFNKIGDQWIKFQGTFKEDIKEGNGLIILTNGETIQAFFSAGVINGQGVFTDLNNRRIKGKWIGNRLQNLIQ